MHEMRNEPTQAGRNASNAGNAIQVARAFISVRTPASSIQSAIGRLFEQTVVDVICKYVVCMFDVFWRTCQRAR